jgi:hypothetical protein
MKTLWLLIAIYGHGAYTVPGLVSQEECERLARSLKAKALVLNSPFPGERHHCISYSGG